MECVKERVTGAACVCVYIYICGNGDGVLVLTVTVVGTRVVVIWRTFHACLGLPFACAACAARACRHAPAVTLSSPDLHRTDKRWTDRHRLEHITDSPVTANR